MVEVEFDVDFCGILECFYVLLVMLWVVLMFMDLFMFVGGFIFWFGKFLE